MFYDRPQGRHHVHVCTNLPCSLRGGRELLRATRSAPRRATPARRRPTAASRSATRNASAPARYAPMLRVDETYHENLDVEQAKRIVDALE